MQTVRISLITVLFLLLSSPAFSSFFNFPSDHVIEYRTNHATAIDWTERKIYTKVTIVNPASSLQSHQQRSLLRFKLLQKATERCFQTLLDINLDSSSLLKAVLMRDEALYSRIQQQVLSLITVVTPPYVSGNNFTAVLALPLLKPGHSLFTLFGKLYPHLRLIPKPDKLVSAGFHYSGLVLDARHLNFKPSIGTRILSKSGRILFDPARSVRTVFRTAGHLLFLSRLDSQQMKKRAGKRFLYLQPAQSTGRFGTDLIVTDADANRLLASPRTREALKTGKLVIICKSFKTN